MLLQRLINRISVSSLRFQNTSSGMKAVYLISEAEQQQRTGSKFAILAVLRSKNNNLLSTKVTYFQRHDNGGDERKWS